MEIKDRVFIVTGASSGIGLSTAIALSGRGAKVALLARSGAALQKLSQQLPGSLPVTADMTKFDRVREAVRTVYQHYSRIDGLVNNAGRSYAASVEEIEPEIFDEIFHLNVLGPIVAMQAVIPSMRARGGGSIVNINSGTAFMTVPQYSVYSSSKRALVGFSLTARAELEKDSIVVSEIYPFITSTNFGKNRMGNPAVGGPSINYAKGDKPEFVAGLVLQAIEEAQAQYFANDRSVKCPRSRPRNTPPTCVRRSSTFLSIQPPSNLQSHHAANRVTAGSSRDREGNSKTVAACLDVQTIQRDSPTGVTQASSRVFNAE
jgi:short-subunit dehydrogenase